MNSPYKGKFKVSQQFKGSSHDGLDLVGIDSKEIYSTIDGTVEIAGWENPKNKAQGFGLYIRLKKNNSSDRYYFGHLSKVKVKIGQKIKCGDLIGIEGNTGKSTGSHCHYCVRGSCLKSKIRDINDISGIPNKIGTYNSSSQEKKSISKIAKEVLEGKWDNGSKRKQKLEAAGYNYSKVQAEVEKLLAKNETAAKKTNEQIAKEVKKGLWGNGSKRKEKLEKAGYNYSEIQKIVNKM